MISLIFTTSLGALGVRFLTLIVPLGKVGLREAKVSCRTRGVAIQAGDLLLPLSLGFWLETLRVRREIWLCGDFCFSFTDTLSLGRRKGRRQDIPKSQLTASRLQQRRGHTEKTPRPAPFTCPGGTLGIRLNDSAS